MENDLKLDMDASSTQLKVNSFLPNSSKVHKRARSQFLTDRQNRSSFSKGKNP